MEERREIHPGITLGRHSYLAPFMVSLNPEVWIGNFCSLAARIMFHGRDNHRTDMASSFPFFTIFPELKDDGYSKGKIRIGHDVWIGDQVSILSGVRIGSGAVIAARTVVTKSVPSYAIVAGNPGEIKKYRFDRETKQELLKIEWWHWSDEEIHENISWFYEPIKDFIKKFKE